MIKKILFCFICVLVGAVFVFSGYTKLGLAAPFSSPIEPFEYTFVDLGFINWHVAPFIARFFIGLEFLIGVLLITNLSLRKLAYKLGVLTLLLFSVYLVLLMIFAGNKGNCGCFGSYIQMTPLQALIKNVIMLAIFLTLNKYHEGWVIPGRWRLLIIVPFVCAFALPFVLNPISFNYSEAYLNKPDENFKLDLEVLYANAKQIDSSAEVLVKKQLSEGKHVIAFLSLTCPHCRIAANKIRIIHKRNSHIPFYFVLNGDEENLKPFFEDTHTDDIPHCMLVGKDDMGGNYFISLAGTNMPAIYLVNSGVVEHDVNYRDLDQGQIEKWMK